MAGSSQRNNLMKVSAALAFAVLVVAGAWLYHKDADFLSAWIPGARPSSAPRNEDASSPAQHAALPPRKDPQTDALPWPSPSQSLPRPDGFRPPATPFPAVSEGTSTPLAGVQDKEQPDQAGEPKTGALPAARQDESAEAAKPAPDAGLNPEPAPNQAKEPPTEQSPLIVYGKGSATDSKGNVVRGEIPARQTPPDTAELYGSPGPSSRKGGGPRVSPKGEDSVVGLAVIQDLAKFLADNYWPAGTHPRARRRGISTATAKWANAKFGVRLPGFSVNQARIAQERTRVLNYVFMPSMIRGLYDLYAERFLNALEQEALSQRRGPGERPLSGAERAEMFMLYGTMAKGLAGTVRAYADTPGARALTKACLDTEQRAEEVHQSFLEAMRTNAPGRALLAKQYQIAVLQREQQRELLVSALRRNGTPQGLDSDTVMYTALWLYRRGDGAKGATKALAEVLDRCAGSLEEHYNRNKSNQKIPAAQIEN